MEKNKISVAKKTLKILENQSFESIKLTTIINKNNSEFIKKKIDLLVNINNFFDYLLKEDLKTLEKSNSKDMLFEVLMARLDILNKYRLQIKKLINYLLSKPQEALKLIPSFLETIILMATLANIDVSGIKGGTKIKGIFILYFLIIFTWNNDETVSLEKTMTTLDKYLSSINKFANYL